MTAFKCTMVIRHSRPLVWSTVRDRLPELVPYMSDVEKIVTESRDEREPGVVRLVNLWTAKAFIPASLASVVRPDMLRWTDYAEWCDSRGECSWRIAPSFLTERIQCGGVARYEHAMARRGTRVTFEGTLQIAPGGGVLASAITNTIEMFITGLIPQNAQKLYRAVGAFLDATARA